jgi:membrane glycosyltransferase
VRFTSRTFPSIRACKLFCIPEEVDTPPVLRDMRGWQDHFRKTEPASLAISDPGFYVRHRPQTRRRPRVAKALLPKIRSGLLLDDREQLLALDERRCFDAWHRSLLNLAPQNRSDW